jgi:hypothetical protein
VNSETWSSTSSCITCMVLHASLNQYHASREKVVHRCPSSCNQSKLSAHARPKMSNFVRQKLLLLQLINYFLCSILVVANSDVAIHKMCLDASKSATTNMERREYFFGQHTSCTLYFTSQFGQD